MSEHLMIQTLFDLKETIATDIFKDCIYPWEALSKIKNEILRIGNTLSSEEYEKKVRISGLQNPLRWRQQRPLQAR